MTQGLCQRVGGCYLGGVWSCQAITQRSRSAAKNEEEGKLSANISRDSRKDKDAPKCPTGGIEEEGRVHVSPRLCSSPGLLRSLPFVSFVQTSRSPSPSPCSSYNAASPREQQPPGLRSLCLVTSSSHHLFNNLIGKHMPLNFSLLQHFLPSLCLSLS